MMHTEHFLAMRSVPVQKVQRAGHCHKGRTIPTTKHTTGTPPAQWSSCRKRTVNILISQCKGIHNTIYLFEFYMVVRMYIGKYIHSDTSTSEDNSFRNHIC